MSPCAPDRDDDSIVSEMDYDRTNIPSVYDAGRTVQADMLRIWLDFFLSNVPEDGVRRIVDVGCGTGRFSAILADAFDAEVIGIDPSEKMLLRAREKAADEQLSFERGSGERLPLQRHSADLVFMSMVFHHLSEPARAARECHRVLREGGHVCLRNSTRDETETYPYLGFFPSIRAIIQEQLMAREDLIALFEAAGFGLVAHDVVWHETAQDWQDFAAKTALKADSFVARLPEEEFKRGMAAMQDHASSAASDAPVGVKVDLFVFGR